jgi:hypothetical protein
MRAGRLVELSYKASWVSALVVVVVAVDERETAARQHGPVNLKGEKGKYSNKGSIIKEASLVPIRPLTSSTPSLI